MCVLVCALVCMCVHVCAYSTVCIHILYQQHKVISKAYFTKVTFISLVVHVEHCAIGNTIPSPVTQSTIATSYT